MKRRALLLSALAAACARPAPRAEETRIVSVSPSMTETVFALGKGDRLVGRTDFCDFPEAAKAVRSIGGFATPNIEAIMAERPTLVVGERGVVSSGGDILKSHGLQTYFPSMKDLGEIRAMIRELGDMLGCTERATQIDRSIGEEIARVGREIVDRPSARVLMLVDVAPLIAVGPESFPHSLIGLAGGTNVVTTGGNYPRIGAESLLALDPDVIIDASLGTHTDSRAALLRASPGADALRALSAGGVVRLPSIRALRPGPRVAEGVAELAGLLRQGAG